MPEIIEDDRIASLFTQFRAEAGTEILPPGTRAAQQTVRRRRATRLVGTAGLALVSLVGATLGFVNMSGGGSVEPAGSHSFGPTLSPDELDRLGVEALAQLGYKPTSDRTRPELQLVRPGIIFGGVRTEASAFTYGLGTVDEPFPQGDYALMAVCMGRGKVSVGWSTPGAAAGSLVVDCASRTPLPAAGYIAFTAPAPGVITLTVTPDDEAIGRAGIAVAVTDPRIVWARNALGEPGPGVVSGAEAVLSVDMMNVDESGSHVADYRLSIACAGAGSIDVTFTIGAATATEALICTTAGATTSLTVRSPTADATMSVLVEANDAARGKAAVAYRVARL